MREFQSDMSSLSGKRNLDRRQMLATSLAVAAAVLPVCAQTAITTGTNGPEAGEVKIPVADGEIPAYRAMPAKGGPFPLVLVVQEIFGVHEHIKDICRRLAKEGYMAVATELYARQGSVAGISYIPEIVKTVVSKVPDAQVLSDLDATVAYAKSTGHADVTRLGITGFCWGGRITWLYAEHNASLKAGVAWYGKLVGDPNPQTPKHPVDLVGELKAPVLGLYGAADTGIPVDTIEAMRSVCQAAGKTCEFVINPDTPHAFNADYRPSYREGPAKDGWARMLAWFRSHGVV